MCKTKLFVIYTKPTDGWELLGYPGVHVRQRVVQAARPAYYTPRNELTMPDANLL